MSDEWECYLQQPPTRPRPVPIVSSYHTWENEMDEAFDAIMASDDTVEVKAAGLTHGGALRAVMGELKAGGMPIFEIIRMIPAIVNLLIEVGPQIADIVKKIRELFEKK